MHVLLGQYDLAPMVEPADVESAMKISFALGKATGVGFTILPSVDVKVVEKLAASK